jgi:putative FmdB family regulatory protein
MPIYEYRCESCQHEFEELVFARDTPKCPSCAATKLQKLMSTPTVGKSKGAASAAPAEGGCGSCEYGGGPRGCGMS